MRVLRIDRPILKHFFRAGEVAKMLNETSSCIRYWERAFNISVNRKENSNRDRLFNRKEVALMHRIQRLLRVEKFTIRGAKIRLAQPPAKVKLEFMNQKIQS